jgi:MFS family permease
MGKLRDSDDARALRFALGFPLMLAAAFVLCAFLIRADLPEPLAVRWDAGGAVDFAPFAAVVGTGAAMIVLIGWAMLVQAAPLSRPAVMRRIMMGAGLSVSLFVTTVLAAVLVGQLGMQDARASRVDVAVLAMGSGAALGLGFVMGFVFKADERWSADDDRAMQEALQRERDPELARDSVSLWVHARSSVFVMLGLATVLPAALLAIAVPWLAAVLVALALIAAAFLFARLRVDRRGLRVFAAGFIRVMDVPAAAIDAATPKDVRAADYGGWGYRSHGTTTALLVSSGPAVVVDSTDGRKLTVSGGSAATADHLAQVLSRVAARARRSGTPPESWTPES